MKTCVVMRWVALFGAIFFVGLVKQARADTVPDTVYVSEGGRANIDVLANDIFDADARVISVTQGQHSDRVLINTDGTVHYRPVPSFEGRDEFFYTAETQNEQANGQVIVFVLPWSEILKTEPDSLVLVAGQGAIIEVLANDRYLGTRSLTITGVNETRFDSDVFVTSDLRLYYRSDAAFLGEDRFFYILADGLGNQRVEWVVIDVIRSGQSSITVDDRISIQNRDTAIVVPLGNDVLLSVPVQITFVPPLFGQANWNAETQVLHYIPPRDFVGLDKFAYVVTLEDGTTSAGQIRIDVRPFNARPEAVDDSVVVSVGRGIVIDVLKNDRDHEGDSLAVVGLTSVSNGSYVLLNADGSVFYRSDVIGAGQFVYEISDGFGDSVFGNVSVEVVANDDAPFARDDTAFVEAGDRINIPVLLNDDFAGDTIGVVATTPGQYSTLVIVNSDQTIHYRAGANYEGSDFFTYTIRDRQGNEASAVVRIFAPGGIPGDFDGDARVGFADFLLFIGTFGSSSGDGRFDFRMDFDADGVIGFADFLFFISKFGK